MAKTIEEINDALKEWQKESPKGRSVLSITGLDDGSIIAIVKGPKQEVTNNIASALLKDSNITEAISQAFRIAIEYANEKTKDN